MTDKFDGVGDYMDAPSNLVPEDGKWHTYSIMSTGSTMHYHGEERINGVLFLYHRIEDDKGLRELHYTRADLVKG